MTKERLELKILLLQIREDEFTRKEELNEFVRYGQLTAEQFTSLNVFDTPYFEPNCIDDYDALFVGGSSDASVLRPNEYPFVKDTKELLTYCLAKDIPVFASCFGFQVVVEALGGKVILDKEHMEIGAYSMQLTEAAKDDLLLHDTPNGFLAISGHKERAVSLPEGAILLASSELCPYHALKMAGKPFYGFQFHPELDKDDLASRLTRYCDRYLEDDGLLKQIIDNLQDTPESNQLIKKFIDRVILGKAK
jgi:GMP synthase (glutamine-hydrolysing)